MNLVFQSLRYRFFHSDHELLFLDDELKRLKHTIHSLVVDGNSSSLLIIGRRGAGKRRLLSQALVEARKDQYVKENLLEVRLNGLVHTDDRIALSSMAKQLHRESLLDSSYLESNAADSQTPKAFSQQLNWFLSGLRSGDKSSKSLLVVLHEFDLFALHRNQILLYNLFDSCQYNNTPLCIIGVTCRLDIMELLEKRVKSRFSHRQIHLISIAAPLNQIDSYGDGDEEDSSKSPAFERYCVAAKHFLTMCPKYVLSTTIQPPNPKDRVELQSAVKKWNQHVSELLMDEIVVDSLRQAWSVSPNLQRLLNLLTLVIAKLDSEKTQIEPVEFIDALCFVRQDAKIGSLKGLCVLELFLVAAFVKLQDINEGQVVNFEILYNEYAKFCRTNCPSYLYEKPVVFKSLDNLIDLELVVCGKEALAVTPGSSTRRAPNSGASNLPYYRPLFCFVSADVLSACLDAYPNCPVELKFWLHARTF